MSDDDWTGLAVTPLHPRIVVACKATEGQPPVAIRAIDGHATPCISFDESYVPFDWASRGPACPSIGVYFTHAEYVPQLLSHGIDRREATGGDAGPPERPRLLDACGRGQVRRVLASPNLIDAPSSSQEYGHFGGRVYVNLSSLQHNQCRTYLTGAPGPWHTLVVTGTPWAAGCIPRACLIGGSAWGRGTWLHVDSTGSDRI